jgi:hypothetical protein
MKSSITIAFLCVICLGLAVVYMLGHWLVAH